MTLTYLHISRRNPFVCFVGDHKRKQKKKSNRQWKPWQLVLRVKGFSLFIDCMASLVSKHLKFFQLISFAWTFFVFIPIGWFFNEISVCFRILIWTTLLDNSQNPLIRFKGIEFVLFFWRFRTFQGTARQLKCHLCANHNYDHHHCRRWWLWWRWNMNCGDHLFGVREWRGGDTRTLSKKNSCLSSWPSSWHFVGLSAPNTKHVQDYCGKWVRERQIRGRRRRQAN